MLKVSFLGMPFKVLGNQYEVGDFAPSFCAIKNDDLSVWSLYKAAKRIRIISVVPSLISPTCQKQTLRFNEEAK